MKKGQRLSLPALLCVLATLPSCTPTMATSGTSDFAVCQAWQPVHWSVEDTDQTIIEAKQNNAARLAWGCPK